MRRQRGAALLVSLLMLLLLTVLAVSAVNMTTLGLRGASNMQGLQLAEAAAQAAIDKKLSDGAGWIRNQASAEVTQDGYTVHIDRPVCLGYITAPGFEERYGEEINRFDNAWRIGAMISSDETVGGESVNITQGVVLKVEVARCTEL